MKCTVLFFFGKYRHYLAVLELVFCDVQCVLSHFAENAKVKNMKGAPPTKKKSLPGLPCTPVHSLVSCAVELHF